MSAARTERWRSGFVTWTTFVLVMLLGIVAVIYILDQNESSVTPVHRRASGEWYRMSPGQRLEALGSGLRRR